MDRVKTVLEITVGVVLGVFLVSVVAAFYGGMAFVIVYGGLFAYKLMMGG